MNTYIIQGKHIKNKTAFVLAIVGCIVREITDNLGRVNNEKGITSLTALTRYLLTILKSELDPSKLIENTYDPLDLICDSEAFHRVQKEADNLVSILSQEMEIKIIGDVDQDWISFMPDFGDKIKIRNEL